MCREPPGTTIAAAGLKNTLNAGRPGRGRVRHPQRAVENRVEGGDAGPALVGRDQDPAAGQPARGRAGHVHRHAVPKLASYR